MIKFGCLRLIPAEEKHFNALILALTQLLQINFESMYFQWEGVGAFRCRFVFYSLKLLTVYNHCV